MFTSHLKLFAWFLRDRRLGLICAKHILCHNTQLFILASRHSLLIGTFLIVIMGIRVLSVGFLFHLSAWISTRAEIISPTFHFWFYLPKNRLSMIEWSSWRFRLRKKPYPTTCCNSLAQTGPFPPGRSTRIIVSNGFRYTRETRKLGTHRTHFCKSLSDSSSFVWALLLRNSLIDRTAPCVWTFIFLHKTAKFSLRWL